MMDVNWFAILLSAVVYMIVGSLWYSPLLFVKPWMKMVGANKNGMGNASKLPMLLGISFICGLVMAYVLSVIIGALNPVSIMDGAVGGFWTWLGFVATFGLVNTLYAGKPMKLFMIDSGYYLVSLILMGMIIVWLR
ncbi:MAG: DUF1761 domain-containing protein [Patescibacteria group bacterium]